MTGSCLVTGGAGFIGCALSRRLIETFDQVTVIDNLHPQVHEASVRPDTLPAAVKLLVGDVTSPDTWNVALNQFKPDVVVHLAAETGTGQSLTEGTRHASVNVVGTTQMLDAFARHGHVPQRVVLSSSRAVYGEGAWQDAAGVVTYPGQRTASMLDNGVWDFPSLKPLAFDAASTHPAPSSIYAATKLAQEHILSAWTSSFDCQLVTLRLQNVYGPGQSLKNAYTGIVALFAQIAREGKSIPIYEDGQIVRDFVYIDDVTAALHRATVADGLSITPYDIGSGTATSILDLGKAIADLYGAPRPKINGRYRAGDVRSASCRIERAVKELNYSPGWTLEMGLRALSDWIVTKRQHSVA